MKFKNRTEIVKCKLTYYVEELYALRNGGWYAIVFGMLIILLTPLFILENMILMLAGKDLGIFQSGEPYLTPRINIEEVPVALRDLFPLAEKWGIGDDADRGVLIRAASKQELDELFHTVGSRMDEIGRWLGSLSEDEISKSDIAGLYLYMMDAFEEAEYLTKDKQ